ncbi:SDR family NAD(P)-dependent oxidoreductase [Baekduia soli]|uniref:SDR family NAD(P)-dependent oxidoreductase n=2 Tax=Baekduia soli TaxID=496014 RepID=A0A5B8UDL7_9ACTN|nr:SDR family NAD(P)-dependent oxidoreductase [Baekduia soli]
MRFDDRVAIVTGAGRGLGRSHALALATRGARIVVNDLGGALAGGGGDPGPAQAVADEIAAAGGEAVANADSVATPEGAEAIVTAALERFGRVDIIINNAGNLDPGGLPGVTAEAIQRHVDVHVLGAFNVTRAAWPHLVDRGYGRIVITSSVGLFGSAHLVGYSTAKGAAVSLGRSLAEAGAPHGITVNQLVPSAETRMVTDPEFRANCNLPPLPPGTRPDPARGPEFVSPMVVLLAHESCPVNGETMTAGIGRFARVFWAETRGLVAPGLEPEDILARWGEVVDEEGYGVPATTAEGVAFRESLLAPQAAERG